MRMFYYSGEGISPYTASIIGFTRFYSICRFGGISLEAFVRAVCGNIKPLIMKKHRSNFFHIKIPFILEYIFVYGCIFTIEVT